MRHLVVLVAFGSVLAGCSVKPSALVAMCPQGATAQGKCVNPDLARNMREGAIVRSQPRISRSGPAVLPSGDRTYKYPNGVETFYGREDYLLFGDSYVRTP